MGKFYFNNNTITNGTIDIQKQIEEINKKLNRTVLMVHNCQNCGATLEIQENHPVFYCKYCNTSYIIGTLRTNSTY